MPQSLVKNYIHITFSTKYREDTLLKKDLPEIFSYMAGILKNLNCTPIVVGGVSNHIHVLCLLDKTTSVSELLDKLKANSSKWIKSLGKEYVNFAWQRGYGSFSVSQSKVEVVRNYIANQERHHNKGTFKEEFIELLEKHELEYDEQYLWD